MKKQTKHTILLASLITFMTGCSEETVWLQPQSGEAIQLTASKQHLITRSGDQIDTFEPGTAYYLSAISASSSDWENPTIQNTGVELENNTIQINANPLPTYPVSGSLDFYGTTYGDKANAPEIVKGNVSIDYSTDTYKDLLFSNNLKAQTAANGVLQMNFKHALSMLTFEVVKQEANELSQVNLKKIAISNTRNKGTFDIVNSTWSPEGDPITRNVYDDDMEVTTVAQTIENSDILIIPNGNEQITVEVTLAINNEDEKTIEYQLKEAEINTDGKITEGKSLAFLPNHKYKLTIMILNNDVRIVAILPQVYEWIDIDMDQKGELTQSTDIYLGQPVTFGNLMWMDRNLGAKSADCENDWYHTIGYYYQHGRNIPFILDIDVWKQYKSYNGKTAFYFGDHAALASEFPDKVMYTWNKNGKKYYKVIGPRAPAGTTKDKLEDKNNPVSYITKDYPTYDKVAKKMGEEGEYGYMQGFARSSKNTNWKIWAIYDTTQEANKANEHEGNDAYWYDSKSQTDKIDNHPCPKGWRLPNHWDLYAFMPESSKLYWADNYQTGDDLSANNKNKNIYWNYRNSELEKKVVDYSWFYFAGKFKINPDDEDEFSYPVSDSYARVYGIKYEGTEKAYRIMIEQKLSKLGDKKLYARIYRFNATKEDKFLISEDKTRWNIHKFDWEHPVEYMDFPLAGFLYENGLTDFGTGSIVRISEADGEGTNWTLYLRSGHNGVAVAGGSRRNLGDQIRCVRDINLKE